MIARYRDELLAGLLTVVSVMAIILVVGVGFGWWRSATQPPAALPLSASASLTPRTVRFGDPIHAHLDISFDRSQVGQRAATVSVSFAPYAAEREPLVVADDGTIRRISYRWSLSCLSASCIPQPALERRFLFPAARVGVGAQSATVAWPPLVVASLISQEDVIHPHLRASLALPPVGYRVEPGLLGSLLLAGAALLFLASAFLLAARVGRAPIGSLAWRRGQTPPLERALALLRDAIARGRPDDQRKALERLARELRGSGRLELAGDARKLAWSAAAPRRSGVDMLVQRVEETLRAS